VVGVVAGGADCGQRRVVGVRVGRLTERHSYPTLTTPLYRRVCISFLWGPTYTKSIQMGPTLYIFLVGNCIRYTVPIQSVYHRVWERPDPSLVDARGVGVLVGVRRRESRHRGVSVAVPVFEVPLGEVRDEVVEAVFAGEVQLGLATDVGGLVGQDVVVWQESQPDGVSHR
jgi:hypothetical protein